MTKQTDLSAHQMLYDRISKLDDEDVPFAMQLIKAYFSGKAAGIAAERKRQRRLRRRKRTD
jgi:hypothetical protein